MEEWFNTFRFDAGILLLLVFFAGSTIVSCVTGVITLASRNGVDDTLDSQQVIALIYIIFPGLLLKIAAAKNFIDDHFKLRFMTLLMLGLSFLLLAGIAGKQ